ncbi:MAG: hypothetical protein WCG90_02155 [Chitinophagia bacterium]|jgi:hypothetical protein
MQKKNTVKMLVKFRFIGMLLFICLLHQLAFATLQNTFGFSSLNSVTISNSYSEKSNLDLYNNQIDLFVESESEDEDELHHENDNSKNSFSNHCNCNSNHYSVLINTLYLRLASTNQSKIELPFFVLYHAWKSDLS